MATEVVKDGTLEITAIAADWDYRAWDWKANGWPAYPRLASIEYHPGGADTFVVKHRDDGGPTRFFGRCQSSNDSRIKYLHGSRLMPYLDFSECTLNAGHKLIFELWRE